jgi:uncharacterized membrane protein
LNKRRKAVRQSLYSGFALGFFKRRFFYHLDSAMGIIAVNGVVESIEPQRWCYGLVPDTNLQSIE